LFRSVDVRLSVVVTRDRVVRRRLESSTSSRCLRR